MRIKVCFTSRREKEIHSGYRPDWVSSDKPEYNGAQLLVKGFPVIRHGQDLEATIVPYAPEYWQTLKVGSKLECKEGSRTTGEAVVLAIEE